MKLADTSIVTPPLDIERIGVFVPEPVEAWTLADFVGLELAAEEENDTE
jgi:hypothetical protein